MKLKTKKDTMKRVKNLSKVAAVALMGACLVLSSCSSKEDNLTQEEETITISLGFGGELVTSESPLTRSSSEDLYVVQVYYYPKGSETLTRYAYGFFSDITNISIDLYADYKYEFSAWCFKNGMQYDSFGHIYTRVTNFNEEGKKLTTADVENEFIYSTETRYEPITYEGLEINNKDYYHEDYYCCYITDYTATTDSSLMFDMFRCVFGYSVNVENIEPGYQLKVRLGDRDQIILTTEQTSFETITHFYNWSTPSYAIWEVLKENNEFVQETSIIVTLIAPNSMEDIIANEPITFTRNKMKNISIRLKENAPQGPTNTKIGFSFETTDMAIDESTTTIIQR